MTRHSNINTNNTSKIRPAPYAPRKRRKSDRATIAAWIAGIAGTVIVLLFFSPFATNISALANPDRSVAQSLLPTVTPTPASAKPIASLAGVEVEKQIPYPVATPLPFAVRAELAITETGVITLPANLRVGPGTDYDIAGGVEPGELVQVVDCNRECDWYKLPDGKWVAAWLVDTTFVQDTAEDASPHTDDLPEGPIHVTWGVVTASLLNVRSGPGANYTVVDFRAQGSCIPLLTVKKDWVQVPLSHDTSGWTASDHVEVVPACPNLPASVVLSPVDSTISAEPIGAG